MKPVDEVAAVNQVKFLPQANLHLLVAVTLKCLQVVDSSLQLLLDHHVNEPLGVVVGLHMAED